MRHSLHIPVTGKFVAMYPLKRKSSRDPTSLGESCSERERIFAEHREVRDLLELRADFAAQGENAALSKLSEAECHTTLLLEEQKNHFLSEARSRLQTGLSINQAYGFIRNAWNSTRRISFLTLHGEKDWICTELEERDTVLQETRMRNLLEMKELKKFCCAETERAQQLRIDELSRRERESQSSVVLFTVRSHDLQDKLNSL